MASPPFAVSFSRRQCMFIIAELATRGREEAEIVKKTMMMLMVKIVMLMVRLMMVMMISMLKLMVMMVAHW